MKLLLALCLVFVFNPFTAQAMSYSVDTSESNLIFSGTHAGNVFEGSFTDWDAAVSFTPNNLSHSWIRASFRPESAQTGNKMYDDNLRSTDWFFVRKHPEAQFESDTITLKDDGTYTATGRLTIRGITQPQNITFMITEHTSETLRAQGYAKIDRFAFEMGMENDPKANWVSQIIDLKLDIIAKPKQN